MTKKRDGRFAKVRTTKKQRDTLDEVKEFLANHSYEIFTVSPKYRRNPNDFLAIEKDRRRFIVLVRPANNGVIELRSYEQRNLHWFLDIAMKDKKFGKKVKWHKQLPVIGGSGSWRLYITRSQRPEFEILARR